MWRISVSLSLSVFSLWYSRKQQTTKKQEEKKGGGGGKSGERWPNCRETNTVWNLPTLHHETKAAAARERPGARACKAMTIDPPMAKTSPSLVHRLLPLSVCVSLRGRVRGRVRLPPSNDFIKDNKIRLYYI